MSLQNLRDVPVDDLLQLGKKLKSLDLAKNQLTALPGKFFKKKIIWAALFDLESRPYSNVIIITNYFPRLSSDSTGVNRKSGN